MKYFFNKFLFYAKRNLTLYFLAFLFIFCLIDVETILNQSKIDIINRSIVHSTSHISNNSQIKTRDDKILYQRSLDYYKTIIEFMPNRPDALGMAGFCSSMLGNNEKAIEYYKKAIELNPHFFYFYYNLGILHFKEGDYKMSIWALNEALKTNPALSLKFIGSSSKIYMPIVNQSKDKVNPPLQLRDSYNQAFKILALSYLKGKHYGDAARIASNSIKQNKSSGSFFKLLLGITAFELKEYAQAIGFLKESINDNPNNSDSYYYLGLTLNELGEPLKGANFIAQSKRIKQLHGSFFDTESTFHLIHY